MTRGKLTMPQKKCPLCGKENVDIVEDLYNFLDGKEVAAIFDDHPAWNPDKGMCALCIDYYKLNY